MAMIAPNEKQYTPIVIPESGSMEGAAQGATLGGSVGGPIGAAIGGVIGFIAGGNGSERRRLKREATKQSYAFGKELYAYEQDVTKSLADNRGEIDTRFNEAMGAARAQYSGSTSAGTEFSGSWLQIEGKLIRERDRAYKDLEESESLFREETALLRSGPAYEWVREDYEYMSAIVSKTSGSHKDDSRSTSYSIRGEGRTGQSIYTAEQREKLRGYSHSGQFRAPYGKIYEQYAEMLKPGMAEFEKYTYGSEEDKAQFVKDTDARIEAANTWYDRQRAVVDYQLDAEQERQEWIDNHRGAN